MSVAIVTDTNSSISVEEGKKLGIYVVAMPIIIDGTTFYEGENLDANTLYEYQATNAKCQTSQPSPADVINVWNQTLKENDEVLYIPMTAGLSGSCAAAKLMAEEFDGKVHVVDNHRISTTQRLSVLDAIELAKQGLDAVTIATKLEKDALEAMIYITLDNLNELVKGGRIGKGAGTVINMLNIKPVMQITGEKLDLVGKAHGAKRAMHMMLDKLKKDRVEKFGEYSDDELVVGISTTYENQADVEAWANMVQSEFPTLTLYKDVLPCSIATHTGKNAFGTGIVKRTR